MSLGIGSVSKGRVYLSFALRLNISRKTHTVSINNYTLPLLTDMILYHVLAITHNCNAVKSMVSAIFIMGDKPAIILRNDSK
jgi:hypothetical protein